MRRDSRSRSVGGCAIALFAACALSSGTADAATFGFGGFSQTSPSNTETGEQQLSVDLFSTSPVQSIPLDGGILPPPPGAVEFIFRNNGLTDSALTGVYFCDPLLLGYVSVFGNQLTGSPGVDFTTPADPNQLPDGESIGFITTFSVGATDPQLEHGVNPGEYVKVTLNLLPGYTFDDVLGRVQSGDLKFGLLVRGFDDGGIETFINNPSPVPLPGAFAMGGAMLAAIGSRRRR